MSRWSLLPLQGRLRASRVWGTLAVAAVLVACGGNSTTPPSSSSNSGPVTLNLVLAGGGEGKAGPPAVQGFEAAHPNVTINYQQFPFDNSYEQKLQLMFASGTAPDVYIAFSSNAPVYINSGLAAPLENVLKKSDFSAGAWQSATYKGHVYYMPWGADVRTLFYRRDFFTAAGLDPDKPPTTWDELAADAVKLTQHDSHGNITRSGMALFTQTDYNFDSQFTQAIESFGGSYLTSDLKKTAFNSAAGQQGLQALVDLITKDKVDVAGANHNDIDEFAAGKIAMIYTGDWVVRTTKDLSVVGVAAPPGKYYTEAGGDSLFMYPKTKHSKEAGELLAFLLNHDNSVTFAINKGRPIPSNLAAANDPQLTSDPIRKAIAPLAAKSSATPLTPKWNELTQAVDPILTAAFYGRSTVAQALKDAQVAGDKVLAGG